MTAGRTINVAELKDLGEKLRAEGRAVVFTNGCFDLLHVGHARCLADASRMGDVFVVAVNSDESVRKNKGGKFPLYGEGDRAEMLLALDGVDYVVIFGDETACGILEALLPDVYAKGPDYPLEELPEKDTVVRLGIDFRHAGDPKGHASRDVIKTIVERFASKGAESPEGP